MKFIIDAHLPKSQLGNMRLQEMKDFFQRNASQIKELLRNYSFLILEAERIRVLE